MKNSDILVILSAAVLGYSIYKEAKLAKVLNKLEMTIDGISNTDVPEIENEMLNAVVQQVVEREVRSGVQRASETAIKNVRNDIYAEVQSSVRNAYGDVVEEVRKELENQIGEVNIERARREVVEKAKERAAEKFESDLTDILQKYNNDLQNVSRIYSSIAGSIGQYSTGRDGLYLKF